MSFSALANMGARIQPGGRFSQRTSKITGFTIHHQAGVDAHGEASNPRREVSANYWIANDGTIIPNIDEEHRAWTTGAVGYPAGAQSDMRNITVEVSNSPEGVRTGSWAISDAAFNSLVALLADCATRHGFPIRRSTNSGVAVHQDFVPTSCPGPYIMGNLGTIIARATAGGGSAGAPTQQTPAATGGKSVAQLADEVQAGVYGNGDQRRQALGGMYDAVQAEVNRRLYGGQAPQVHVNIDQLAHAVLRGEYGNGDDRMRRLGNNYAAVQARVNQLLNIVPAPAGPDIEGMARAAIRGDYGNGAQRQAALGANYAAVQARVNQILGIG